MPTVISLFLFILLNLLFCLSQQQKESKLLMVNELFRHGARYPVHPNNIDGSNYTFAQHSFGQLTTNGKKMHYLLGQQLYKAYWNSLFNGTDYLTHYNQSKFYIKSTDVNRTIESVQSQMMGILENIAVLSLDKNMTEFSKPQWNEQITVDIGDVFPKSRTFHPIAIHVQKSGSQAFNRGDFLRAYDSSNCPNQDVWQYQNRQAPKVKQILQNKNITLALQALSKQVGRNVSFWQAPDFYDNFECAQYMGKKYINVFNQSQYKYPFNYIRSFQMYIDLFYTSKQIRATATGYLNQTVHNMKKIMKNKQQVQWNIYSAHDTTVGNMLAALNLTNVDCIYQNFLNNKSTNSDTCIVIYPQFASNLIFQLFQNSTFKIRYNGQYRKVPFCNWQLQCHVDKFFAWFDSFKDLNYLSTCGVNDHNAQIYFSIAAGQFILLLVVILVVLVSYMKKSLNKHKEMINKNNNQRQGQSNKYDKLQNENVQKQSTNEDNSNLLKQSLLTDS